jgi:hypothetical protein
MKRAALVLGALVLLLLILEGGIRVYSAVWFPRMMQLDDELGWRHTPNARRVFVNELGEAAEVRQNAYGHRGRTFPLAKSPGKLRVLVLGDSFTEGVQVGEDDLFTALLERGDPRLEVLNAGVAGYGTVQEYLYLARDGLAHNPDVVLLLIFENDLTDNCLSAYAGFGPRPHAVFRDGAVRITRHPDPGEFLKYTLPVPFADTLNRHSLLFYVLNDRVYRRLRAAEMHAMQGTDRERTKACGRYEVMFGLLEELAALLSARGIRLGLVLVPSREQAEHGRAPVLEPIVDYSARRGIAHLSLLPRFSREIDTRPYFPADIHWTRRGHRLAAEEISGFLDRLAESAGGAATAGQQR